MTTLGLSKDFFVTGESENVLKLARKSIKFLLYQRNPDYEVLSILEAILGIHINS